MPQRHRMAVYTAASQRFRSKISETGTFTAYQSDMTIVGPALEAVDNVSQTGTAFGQVGRVDLRDIAETNDLGPGAGTRNQGFHLLGRQILSLVDNEEFVQKGATAHEVQ